MPSSSTWRILVLTAARSVVSHRTKSLIVGFILMFGTMLLVVGTSFLDSVQSSMRKTVTSSLAGDLQIYPSEGEDELALFGSMTFGGEDIGEFEDFSRIREPVEALPNVRALVPMGITTSRFVRGNRIDEVLALLREAVNAGSWERVDELADQLRTMARDLKDENQNRMAVSANPEQYEERLADIAPLLTDAFWQQRLRESPRETLQYLDTRIAPLASGGSTIILRLLGTDPARFSEHFDRFRIDKGQMIPEGQRGLLIARNLHEDELKNQVAEQLDNLHEKLVEEGETIADSPVLQTDVERMKKQWRSLLFGLRPETVDRVEARLREFLDASDGSGKQASAEELLTSFLSLDDANFRRRHDFFYDQLAPLLNIYDIEVGDVVTVQSFGQAGFTRSANVKVWGTYVFTGLEDSDLAGSMTIADLMTFRQLYGVLSKEARAELESIRQETGVEDVRREEAEDALFGGDSDLIEERATGETIDEMAGLDEGSKTDDDDESTARKSGARLQGGLEGTYTREEIDRGLARNAAVILEDPAKQNRTMEAIRRLNDEQKLGIEVVDWQTAAGIVGQFVTVIRLVLYTAITIIFLVALVIINNSMVMATVERTGEIGTMRAIGAQRWYVSAMFLLETLILGLVAGLVGSALGAGIVLLFGQIGVPAGSDFLVFLFSGDYLYPALSPWNIVLALGIIIVVSALSTLYPARLATRIQPVVAMRGK